MQYRAGQTYLIQVTLEVEVTPDEDCNHEGIGEYAVAELLNKDNLADCVVEHTRMPWAGPGGRADESDDTEEDGPVKLHNPEDALTAWQDLFAQRDDAGSIINLNEVPALSSNQLQFIQDCLDCDLSIRRYSGRAMYGRECPGVTVSHPSLLHTSVTVTKDNMGMDYIMYVP